MKIYTKTGDKGDTGLWGPRRVAKDNARIQAYGTVDECNAVLGVARSLLQDPALDNLLAQLQNQLFVVGSDLAAFDLTMDNVPRIQATDVEKLEQEIDQLENELPPLTQFILPGGTPAAAQLHLARTVCRRSERETVALTTQEEINPHVVKYLNRLSDLLFVLGRVANHRAGQPDVPWQKP